VPLVLIAAWATWKHVPESRDDQASAHFDWAGAGIVALAVGGLAFGAIYGQQRDWKDPIGYVVLALGVLATAALPFWMRNASHPLIPLDLFRSRNFTVTRSEERRVGKECRARAAPVHEKKKRIAPMIRT